MGHIEYLDTAHRWAIYKSGCTKVQVGCLIMSTDRRSALGANTTDKSCKLHGCLRIQKYGDDAKSHRNPDDCRACHSEIDALANAAAQGIKTLGATAYVTRYPCEACARALVRAGITRIVYGREQEISSMTKEILKGIEVVWLRGWKREDTTR